MPVDLSGIVVNYNTCFLFDEFFASLNGVGRPLGLEVLFIDNASTDTSSAYLKAMSGGVAITFNDKNAVFGRANNQAAPLVQGRYALLLNTNAFVSPNTLAKTTAWMDAHPDCGVLGVRLTDRSGALQPSYRYFQTPFNIFLGRTGLQRLFPWVVLVDDMAWDHASVRECDWVPGCYYLIRREVLDQVGLFAPRFFMYYEEVDHRRRVKAAGWKVMYYPDTSVVRIGVESAKSVSAVTESGRQISSLMIEGEVLYFRTHYGLRGLVWHVFLVNLGDLLLLAKDVFKQRGLSVMRSNWQHAILTLRLLFQTRLATRSTVILLCLTISAVI
ncbi:MAG: glycosyltransferase family 2 protein [Methylophilaceae bacterium]|nr:glycosyltransferase family 2 protein [Methylophilaceae bacterium]